MLRKSVLAAVTGALLLTSSGAWALDPESTQAYCDAVRQAAQQAQQRHVQIYTPRQDPGKTFDDATQSCLDGIISFPSSFKFTTLTMAGMEELMKQMARQMLQKTCQSARDQYDRAVADAMRTVNDAGNDIPGVGWQVGTAGAPVSVKPVEPEPSLWGSIVNALGGGKP